MKEKSSLEGKVLPRTTRSIKLGLTLVAALTFPSCEQAENNSSNYTPGQVEIDPNAVAASQPIYPTTQPTTQPSHPVYVPTRTYLEPLPGMNYGSSRPSNSGSSNNSSSGSNNSSNNSGSHNSASSGEGSHSSGGHSAPSHRGGFGSSGHGSGS